MPNNTPGLALRDIRGPLTDLMQKLDGFDGEAWKGALNLFLRKENPWIEVHPKPAFNRLFESKTIIISATDGQTTIAKAGSVFDDIWGNFSNQGINRPGLATQETEVSVYQIRKFGKFSEIYGLLTDSPTKLIFEQNQIVGFCDENRKLFKKDGLATFFLFKPSDDNEFFVAIVRLVSGKLTVSFEDLDDFFVQDACRGHRIVVPKQ